MLFFDRLALLEENVRITASAASSGSISDGAATIAGGTSTKLPLVGSFDGDKPSVCMAGDQSTCYSSGQCSDTTRVSRCPMDRGQYLAIETSKGYVRGGRSLRGSAGRLRDDLEGMRLEEVI